MTALINPELGIVIIGRNEGERLDRCLRSAARNANKLIYVDSGSTDHSVEKAKEFGAIVIELDTNIPFTAARARNQGWRKLLELNPSIRYIHFIDGDCEFVGDWVNTAIQYIRSQPSFAVVCGRRKERYPEASVYNLLCDIEWDTPVGEARECGGDSLMSVSALKQVEGFRDELIAGEEPELCFRLRQAGWKIARLGNIMTLHDAAIFHFNQWWNRAMRAGYAYAEGFYLNGKLDEGYGNVKSIFFWSIFLPVTICVLTFVQYPLVILVLIYPTRAFLLTLKYQRNFQSWYPSLLYAISNVLIQFPQALGLSKFLINKFFGRRASIIEYK